jgi:hypothetical protein
MRFRPKFQKALGLKTSPTGVSDPTTRSLETFSSMNMSIPRTISWTLRFPEMPLELSALQNSRRKNFG